MNTLWRRTRTFLAKVSKSITRIQSGSPAIVSTLNALRRALEAEGASFPSDGSVVVSREAVAKRKAALHRRDPDGAN